MASTEEALRTESATMQELARRHLWMHFTRLGAYENADIPIMSAYLLLVALIFVTINLVVDLLYAAVDPRIRIVARPA